MKYKVDNIFVSMTSDCASDFSCLSGEKECFCKIIGYIDNEYLFIKDENNCICHYKSEFAGSFVCTCPTRREIYKCYTV